jgi:hypothetical protein
MKERCLEETAMIVDMFDDIEKKHAIVGGFEGSLSIENVIAKPATGLANGLLEREFVQIEAVDGCAECLLDLPLHEAGAATDFREPGGAPRKIARELAKHLKPASDPEVFGGREGKPGVSHANALGL